MDALLPQFSLSIEQITEAFAKQVVSTAKVNITAVIRANLPMWETKLFPVIGAYEISKYEVLADILIEAGCRSAEMSVKERKLFVEQVGVAIRRIKAQGGELTATQKRKAARAAIPPEMLRPGSSLNAGRHITTAIDTKQGVVVPPASVVPGQGVVGVSKAAAVVPVPVSGGTPQPINDGAKFSFKAHLIRLKKEPRGTPWNEADDELHQAFIDLAKEKNCSIKELNLYLLPTDESKRNCLVAYMAKIDITKKVF